MSEKFDPVLIALIRDVDPNILAKDICSVQPMPDDCLKGLFAGAKSEEELKAKGYRPVSGMGLMWIKDDNS